MSKCLSCKKELPAGASFCPGCGKAVEGEAPASKRVKIKNSYATLGWTLGILFALLTLFTLFTGDFAASIPLAAAAALLIPPAREAVFARTSIKIPGIVRFVAVLGLFMWGSHLASPEVGEPEPAVAEAIDAAPNNAAPKVDEASSAEKSANASGIAGVKMHRLAREKVSATLKDPRSAEFRNQRGSCGEVNAKNAFGAYTGFKRFMVSGGDLVLIDGDPGLTADAFNDAWIRLCGPNGQLANIFED